MVTQPHSLPIWRLLVPACALLLWTGGSHIASGQRFPGEKSGVTRPNPAPNPRTKTLSETRGNKTQQAIERAIELGNSARNGNDLSQAFAHYQIAVKLRQQEARAYYGMGNLYSDISCSDSAIAAYRKALELKKDYVEARVGLGYAYAEAERFDHAQEQFEKALEFTPTDAAANIGLGLVQAKKGKHQEGIARINSVIKTHSNEDQALAYVALGDIYSYDLMDSQSAVQHYMKAISLKPNFAKAYLSLGAAQVSGAMALSFVGWNETRSQEKRQIIAKQASENIKRALELNANELHGHVALGLALAAQFRYQEVTKEIQTHFAKVKKIESLVSVVAPNCDSDFNIFYAAGNLVLGWAYALEGVSETDKKRQADLFAKAIEQLNQSIKQREDFAFSYMALGLIYLLQEKYKEAIEPFKKAILFVEGNVHKATAYEGIGLCYSMMERDSEAIEHLQESIKLNPNNYSSHLNLALIYGKQGKTDEKIELLKKVIELEPEVNIHTYYNLADARAAKFVSTRNEADWEEAMKLLKKITGINPDFGQAHMLMGLLYLERANADEAIASLKKAAAYLPAEHGVYFLLGRAYYEFKSNNVAAIENVKQAIKLLESTPAAKPAKQFENPLMDPSVTYNLYLAAIYHRKGDIDEAIKQLLKLCDIAPKFVQAHMGLANMYKLQKNYPEAIKRLKLAIEVAPTDLNSYIKLAEVYEDQRNNNDAARYYEEAAKNLRADDSSNKNLLLGRVARLQGRYEEAIGYFQKLIALEPRDKAYYEMGLTYIAMGNRSAALEQYQKLVQSKSTLAEEMLEKIKVMK